MGWNSSNGRSRLSLSLCVLFALLLAGLPRAQAQIYKYKKKDGTVVYTDKLSDLPPERRAHYNKKAQEEKEKREKALERMTEAERRAAKLAEERKKLMAAELEEAERLRRLAAIDESIRSLTARNEKREQRKAYWQEKKKKLEKELEEAVAAYREAQEEYEKLALKVGYALFPGQRKRLLELQEKLPELEAEVDDVIRRLTEELPEKARKAGVPPGWLRD